MASCSRVPDMERPDAEDNELVKFSVLLSLLRVSGVTNGWVKLGFFAGELMTLSDARGVEKFRVASGVSRNWDGREQVGPSTTTRLLISSKTAEPCKSPQSHGLLFILTVWRFSSTSALLTRLGSSNPHLCKLSSTK